MKLLIIIYIFETNSTRLNKSISIHQFVSRLSAYQSSDRRALHSLHNGWRGTEKLCLQLCKSLHCPKSAGDTRVIHNFLCGHLLWSSFLYYM